MEAAQKWVDRQKAAGLPFRMLDRQDIPKYLLFLLDSKDLLSDELFKEYISPQVHRKDEMYMELDLRK